jgi:hypothetical protein
MDSLGLIAVVTGGALMAWGIGDWLGSRAGRWYYDRKVRHVERQIGRHVMEAMILPQAGFGEAGAFSERYVEASGTVVTDDLELVKAWLEDVGNRLREVGIKFVSQSYVAKDGSEVYWSIGASDPVSTRDELALMVGNAIEAAGAIPS